MIVMLLEQENINSYDLTSLKRIFYGTAPMPTSKLREAVAIFGNIFRQNYGLTEAVQPLAHLTPQEHVLDGEQEVVSRLGSAGTRAIGLEIRIVDENDADVPPGRIGEILLRSPHISPGYLNLTEATAQTYKGGWLHTGDLGYRDPGGYLYSVDRKKDMIISGGFNIYSREVEIFLDSHPAVLESAVIGVDDEKWGEAVKAFVVLKKEKAKPSERILMDFCNESGLSRYKIPKHIRFIESLPKNENGKIIKKDLKGL
jgi:acyl-CoA synthetase (AMP-forming)/AMP-acid ligase II